MTRFDGDVKVTGNFDDATTAGVKKFQQAQQVSADGIVGPATGDLVLDHLNEDNYKDDGKPPSARGLLYKVSH